MLVHGYGKAYVVRMVFGLKVSGMMYGMECFDVSKVLTCACVGYRIG